MHLRPHQAAFLKENPPKAILAWEMRVGKTLPAALWVDLPEQAGNTYIVCPKQLLKDWQHMHTKAVVLTKEQFKKATITNPTAIVVDEAHYFASPLFLKGRSQLATSLYTVLKDHPACHVLLLTATPIRQDAWSLHTLLCYMGVYYPWKEWRDRFFELRRMPYLRFAAYFPRDDWRTNIRPYVAEHCNVVSLKDLVANLPPIEPTYLTVKHAPYKKPTDEVVTWTHEHQWEQQGKGKAILALGYRKVLVVAHYTAQIDALAKELRHDRPVYILDGRTKDADAVKKAAQGADDCYFIVQASMGFGFDGWMFGAMVFASMSHSCGHHTQMLGRLRHLDHLKTISVYYLLGGRWDRRILETIERGKDFNPHHCVA